MKKALRFVADNLAEYMEKLLLVLFGVGLGVKILVVNHGIDPRELNLEMMVADYILIIFAPLAAVGLNLIINRMLPADPVDIDTVIDDVYELQDNVNKILETVSE